MIREPQLRRNRAEVGRLPDFLIIGAQRSGTTTLARLTGSHPEVFIPARKELHFFDIQYERGEDWYRRQFAPGRALPVVGEATPVYLYVDGIEQRMVSMVPNAKLIVILRNPVDRAYSHYWQSRGRGRENLSFADAVDAEPSRLADPDRVFAAMHAYLDRGRYHEQLERITQLYPRQQLHVFLLDDLNASRAGTMKGVWDFLSVRSDVTLPDVGPVNAYVAYRSATLRRHYKRMPSPVRRVVRRLNARPGRYPPMDEALRRRLLDHFAPANDRLAAWLGRDLSVWSR